MTTSQKFEVVLFGYLYLVEINYIDSN